LIAANNGSRTFAKNYIYFQYFKRDVFPDFSINFRFAQNIDDSSHQYTLVANYYFSDNLGAAVNVVVNKPGRKSVNESEYLQYVNSAAFVGLNYYF